MNSPVLPSLWPIGFAVGIACTLIGAIVSLPVAIAGFVITLVCGILWVRDFTTREVRREVQQTNVKDIRTGGDVNVSQHQGEKK